MRKDKIINFWYDLDMYKVLNYREDEKWVETCLACGDCSWGERAHIFARALRGTNNVENIHLLCSLCHAQSEYLNGVDYWIWLCLKSHFYTEGKLFNHESDLSLLLKEEPVLIPRLLRYESHNIPEYTFVWNKLVEAEKECVAEGIIHPLPYPRDKVEYIECYLKAILLHLYEKYESLLKIGIALSEHAQKFINGIPMEYDYYA